MKGSKGRTVILISRQRSREISEEASAEIIAMLGSFSSSMKDVTGTVDNFEARECQ